MPQTISRSRASRLIVFGLLITISALACDDVKACVPKWGTGRRIQVVMAGGESLIGRIASTEPDGFTLGPDKPGGISHELKYSELKSATTRWTTSTKWLVAGAIYGGTTLLFALTLGN